MKTCVTPISLKDNRHSKQRSAFLYWHVYSPCFDCLSFLIIWDVLHNSILLHRTGMVVSLESICISTTSSSSWQLKRRAFFDLSNARHLFQLSVAHKMQSLSGLSYTFTGNTSGKRHNFIWSSCFLDSPLYHSLSHCRQLFPSVFVCFFPNFHYWVTYL